MVGRMECETVQHFHSMELQMGINDRECVTLCSNKFDRLRVNLCYRGAQVLETGDGRRSLARCKKCIDAVLMATTTLPN